MLWHPILSLLWVFISFCFIPCFSTWGDIVWHQQHIFPNNLVSPQKMKWCSNINVKMFKRKCLKVSRQSIQYIHKQYSYSKTSILLKTSISLVLHHPDMNCAWYVLAWQHEYTICPNKTKRCELGQKHTDQAPSHHLSGCIIPFL